MASEQKRRARIKDKMKSLRMLVPHVEGANTADFLNEVYDYIVTLRRRADPHDPTDTCHHPVGTIPCLDLNASASTESKEGDRETRRCSMPSVCPAAAPAAVSKPRSSSPSDIANTVNTANTAHTEQEQEQTPIKLSAREAIPQVQAGSDASARKVASGAKCETGNTSSRGVSSGAEEVAWSRCGLKRARDCRSDEEGEVQSDEQSKSDPARADVLEQWQQQQQQQQPQDSPQKQECSAECRRVDDVEEDVDEEGEDEEEEDEGEIETEEEEEREESEERDERGKTDMDERQEGEEEGERQSQQMAAAFSGSSERREQGSRESRRVTVDGTVGGETGGDTRAAEAATSKQPLRSTLRSLRGENAAAAHGAPAAPTSSADLPVSGKQESAGGGTLHALRAQQAKLHTSFPGRMGGLTAACPAPPAASPASALPPGKRRRRSASSTAEPATRTTSQMVFRPIAMKPRP
ncbi:unnamed protein product [Closterium sp. Yama58-4]|nr:unnamed protein product [Closterium sp. Yama58-4]